MINFDILDVQKKIGYKFKNWDYLFTAFTHSSYANEHSVSSYERLEFLGDSIVNLVIANHLFNRFPNENEGFLTKARARIVSAKTLSAAVDDLDIAKYIRTAGGTIGEEVKNSVNVKSDIFEAISGAIMLDGGCEPCENFILEKLSYFINDDFNNDNLTDYKSRLLEKAKQQGQEALFETSALGNGGFVSTVFIDGEPCGKGEGNSKKSAEQSAAKTVLERKTV